MSEEFAEFLLEIGCEEIPARFIGGAAADLVQRVEGVLDAAGLAHGASRSLSTPRRLAVIVQGVALRQKDRDEEVTGPPVRAAFGSDGRPTPAAIGFAQKMGVEVAALSRIPTPKGEYLGVRRRVAGRTASEILATGLPGAIASMSFPKTMRWGDGSRRFVRPVHWIVAMIGTESIPLELFGIRAGHESIGHRVLAPGPVPIESAGAYPASLLARGVAVDRAARLDALSRRFEELASGAGVRLVPDAELLEEVVDLVEHPGVASGSFPAEFLTLPREILITTLRHHQKAFSTEDARGLANHFLVVADIEGDPEGQVRRGNEWVVAGRLADARFFFQEDRKIPFGSRAEKLAHVTFHAKAGSYLDKSRRIETIALALAGRLDDGGAKDSLDLTALRVAARLCKCDLTTGLVGEFPELQGIAGGLYAGLDAAYRTPELPERASQAIYDHYRPAAARDELPRSLEGALLAVADRMDTLVALSRVIGLPTGSKDPFGLRRAAFGAIRVVAERPLPLSLHDLIEVSLDAIERDRSTTEDPVGYDPLLTFVIERLKFWLSETARISYDTIDAVLHRGGGTRAPIEPVPRLTGKVRALQELRGEPDFAALIEIHKRCRNILRQAAEGPGEPPATESLRADPKESEVLERLHTNLRTAEIDTAKWLGADHYQRALLELVRLRPFLSDFFDHVLVMHPDPALRGQRLSTVRRIASMIEEVADLTQISISREELQIQLGRLGSG